MTKQLTWETCATNSPSHCSVCCSVCAAMCVLQSSIEHDETADFPNLRDEFADLLQCVSCDVCVAFFYRIWRNSQLMKSARRIRRSLSLFQSPPPGVDEVVALTEVMKVVKVNIYMYVYAYVCKYLYMYVYIDISLSFSFSLFHWWRLWSLWRYIYIYINIYTYIYMYIYIYMYS